MSDATIHPGNPKNTHYAPDAVGLLRWWLLAAAILAMWIAASHTHAQTVQSQIGTPVFAAIGESADASLDGMLCALPAGGAVKCLGRFPSGNFLSPVDVQGFTDVATQTEPARTWVPAKLVSNRRGSCAVVSSTGPGALLGKSQARCWGSSGIPTYFGQDNAVAATFAGDAVVDVAVSQNTHMCAVTAKGTVRCFGSATSESFGYLGTRDLDGDMVVADGITKLRGSQVTTGVSHSCALTLAGRVACWGRNVFGQLTGVPSDDIIATPTAAPLPPDLAVTSISAGWRFTCALSTTATVWCWGGDVNPAPRRLNTANGAMSMISGDNFPCVLTAGNGIKCDIALPDIAGATSNMHGVVAASHSTLLRSNALLLQRNGSVLFWSQSGNPAIESFPFFNSKVSAVSGNTGLGACAMISPGIVRCWGNGPLGNGSATTGATQTPVTVTGLESGTQWLANNRFETCAVNATHQIVCWTSAVPPVVAGGVDGSNVSGNDLRASRIALGDNFRCALMQSGVVKCWGNNTVGQLGIGTAGSTVTTTVGAAVDFGAGVTASAVAAGGGFVNSACAIVTGEGVKCWGSNSAGQLGNSTIAAGSFSVTPVDVAGLTAGVKGLAVGSQFACAINASNGVLCWGKNDVGQLGDGGNTDRATPAVVSGLSSGVTAITAGSGSACALLANGRVKCWGRNNAGQLGNGTTTDSNVPVDAVGVSGATLVTMGGQGTPFACAETAVEGLRCWGFNLGGQLGDGTTTNRSTAVTVWPGQSIDFTPPTHLRRGVATPLAAVSSSGLPVSFDSYTPSACTVSGDTTTGFSVLVGASATDVALCGVRATQAGGVGAQFAAAPQRLALMQVTDADCGSANGVTVNSPPSTNLCAIGTASAVLPAASSYRWSCNTATSLGGATCNAPFARLNIDASDASSKYLAAGDGAMLLRYLFGMRGDALTAGIFGSNPQRTSAQVETHIADNLLLFDVDGDGQTLPLTDGMMILRRMLGMSGSALTEGLKRTALTDEGVAAMIDRLRP